MFNDYFISFDAENVSKTSLTSNSAYRFLAEIVNKPSSCFNCVLHYVCYHNFEHIPYQYYLKGMQIFQKLLQN